MLAAALGLACVLGGCASNAPTIRGQVRGQVGHGTQGAEDVEGRVCIACGQQCLGVIELRAEVVWVEQQRAFKCLNGRGGVMLLQQPLPVMPVVARAAQTQPL